VSSAVWGSCLFARCLLLSVVAACLVPQSDWAGCVSVVFLLFIMSAVEAITTFLRVNDPKVGTPEAKNETCVSCARLIHVALSWFACAMAGSSALAARSLLNETRPLA